MALKPWHHVGHRVLANPFTPQGRVYCLGCGEWESTRHEARYEGTVHAMKEWCQRCGTVVSYALWDQQDDPATRQRAFEWAQAREEGLDEQVRQQLQ